jgi:hypothetical protein
MSEGAWNARRECLRVADATEANAALVDARMQARLADLGGVALPGSGLRAVTHIPSGRFHNKIGWGVPT